MTDREELAHLEAEYPHQPPAAWGADLERINLLRHRLGMDAILHAELMPRPARPTAPAAVRKPKPKDHTAARAAFAAYLAKRAEMAPHREYAERVARATAGPARTPVRPMATMGPGGGPLLCDVCGKPMLLEGGRWNRRPVDEAWAGTPNPPADWVSYISGGMVVEIEVNGTLRIYHGHINHGAHECSAKGKAAIEAAEARHVRAVPAGLPDALYAFLADERPELGDAGRWRLVNEVLNELYSFDPGLGLNRPA